MPQVDDGWWRLHCTDLLDLIRRDEKCVCCGVGAVEVDHIVPQEYVRRCGVMVIKRPQAYSKLLALESGSAQFLCRGCNKSKGRSTFCLLHDRYLGLWNHLPALDNMEGNN